MSLENPLSILYNSNGVELAVSSSQAIDVSGSQPGFMIAGSGSDGNAYLLRSTSSGSLYTVLADNFGTSTNPFSVTLSNSAGSPGTSTNPIFITSSLSSPVYVSVSSSNTNPVFISGTVNGTFTAAPNTPVSQGLPGGIGDAWNIKITDGVNVLGSSSQFPLFVALSGNLGTANAPFTVTLSGGLGTSTNPIYMTSSLTSPVYVSVSSSNSAPVTVVFSGGLGTSNAPLTVTLSGANGSSTNPFYMTSSLTSPVYVSVSSSAAAPVFITGSIVSVQDINTTATVTSSNGVTSTVTLLAANTLRRGALFYNDSSKILFLKLGSAATTTDFSVRLSSQGYYEVPNNYVGIVTGIWNGVNGAVYITEIVD